MLKNVILSPSAVILNEVKNLSVLSLRRDSSIAALSQNDVKSALFLIVLFVAAPILCWADMAAADAAYERADFYSAQKEYRILAEKGNAEAQNKLGHMYRYGLGVAQDYTEALKWFRKSAAQHHHPAEVNLGFMYGGGLGVPQSYEEQMRWIRHAAEEGDARAQYYLGVTLLEDRRVARRAVEATEWIRRAAKQGLGEAQYELGRMYAKGQGVAHDAYNAYFWLYLSSLHGQRPGALLKSLSKKMATEQVSRALTAAKKWKPVAQKQGRL